MVIKPSVNAEYHKAKTIIMHEPGDETFLGSLHGEAALYGKKPFDRYKIIDEHRNYVKTLRKNGIETILLKDILLKDTIDEKNLPKKGKALESLVDFAEKSLKIFYPISLSQEKLSEMKDYNKDTLKNTNPNDLVRIILEKPTIIIDWSNEGNTEFIAKSYSENPLMNMHFLRDQQITTDKGIVLGKMNETQITKYCFNKLGIKPIYEVNGDGRLEGGDFIPCGDYAFIGQGLRTNAEAIQQLLKNKVFGYKEIAVVKDSFKSQEEMHLDTFLNIAGSKKAVILEDRVEHYNNGSLVPPNPEKETVVDVYKLKNQEYVKDKTLSFQDYLATKGFNIYDKSLITLTKEQQLNYGINFLTLEENKIITVKDVIDKDYIKRMEGIEILSVDLNNFVNTYGAPHCATQVISRLDN